MPQLSIRLRATSGFPFRKIIWSLVSVATLRTFSFGGTCGWLASGCYGEMILKTVATDTLQKWDQRLSA